MKDFEETSICVDIIRAIAQIEGTSPHDLEYRLNDHIHTDALELLANAGRGPWELSFRVPRHEITVRDDRTIVIDGQLVRGAS